MNDKKSPNKIASQSANTYTPPPPIAMQAIVHVLNAEGGYVNNPNDLGGETSYGISKRWYPHLDIFNLTLTKAVDIYYQDYWLKNKCHLLPPSIATMVFDTAVNQGGSFARKTLQMLVGVNQDGIIGSQTVAATSLTSANLLLVDYAKCRAQRYSELAKEDPTQVIFLTGWLNRVFAVLGSSLLLISKPVNRGK